LLAALNHPNIATKHPGMDWRLDPRPSKRAALNIDAADTTAAQVWLDPVKAQDGTGATEGAGDGDEGGVGRPVISASSAAGLSRSWPSWPAAIGHVLVSDLLHLWISLLTAGRCHCQETERHNRAEQLLFALPDYVPCAALAR